MLHYNSEVNGVLLLHYMYLIALVTLQMWMNDVKYNQVLNQTWVPPGVNSQATLQYTKSFKLAAPLPALRTLSRSINIILKWTNLCNEYFYFWYFKYIFMLILFYFFLSNMLNCRTFTCNRVFLHSGTSPTSVCLCMADRCGWIGDCEIARLQNWKKNDTN